MDMQTVCSFSPSHMRLKSYSIRDFHKHTNLAIWALNAFLVKAKKILEQRVTWSLIQPTLALSIQNFTYLIATIEQKDDISGN